MNYVYPAIFSPEDDAFNVSFPDLPGCLTFGVGMEDAISMAKDVLALYLHPDDSLKSGAKTVPDPSRPEDIQVENEGDFVVMIDCEEDYKNMCIIFCDNNDGVPTRIEWKGYTGSVSYDEENRCYFGKLSGVSQGHSVTYEGEEIDDLMNDFRGAVSDYKALLVDMAMKRPYRVEIIEDKEDGGFALSCPELPGCITCADTIEQGMEMLEDAKRCWFTACVEDRIEIPEPTNCDN